MELFILLSLSFILETLDLQLLFQDAALNLAHVFVRLQHFCKEVIRSTDWQLCLHKNLHAFHDIFSGDIIEWDLSFNIIMNIKLLGNDNWVLTSNSHMLSEWNSTLLLDQFCRLESIVEIWSHFLKSFLNQFTLKYMFLTKLFCFQSFKVFWLSLLITHHLIFTLLFVIVFSWEFLIYFNL